MTSPYHAGATVRSIAGRAGDVTLTVADVADAAPLDNPAFPRSISIGANATAAYPVSLSIAETGHAVSRRAGVVVGTGWGIGQDSQGTGERDFFIFANATGTYPVRAHPDGAVRLAASGADEALRLDPLTGTVRCPRIGTTAAAANAVLDADDGNTLLRSTSSARYKTQIEDLEPAIADTVVLGARPVWYRSLATADRPDWSWYGLIAEEVAALDPRLVFWTHRTKSATGEEMVPVGTDENGNSVCSPRPFTTQTPDLDAPPVPDGVQYERLTVLLLSVVQRQNAALAALTARVAALETAA